MIICWPSKFYFPFTMCANMNSMYLYIFDDGGIQFSIEGVGRVGVAGLGLEQVLDPPDKPK